jgi:hypothetical protein
MASAADPDTTYQVVQQVLVEKKYQVLERNDVERTMIVRSHVDEDDPTTQTLISIQTTADGKVTFKPSGYLVKPDGLIHRMLNNEIDELSEEITARLGKPAPANTQASADVATSAAPATVATAWNEPAYDPKIWGPGNFTCLPVKIPTEDQQSLKLRLSNGEIAELVLSLAYATELCRSPSQCPIATGCPALGFGDSQQVSALAQRLVNKEIGETATVLDHGEPVVNINLPSHGLIAKAMEQLKPTKTPPVGTK